MLSKYENTICPRIMKKVEEEKMKTKQYIVKPAIGNNFQVSIGKNGYVV